MIRILVSFLFILFAASLSGKGLVVNEFSNGCSGKQEYLELVVVGPPGTEVDLRGFIMDDNNGLSGASCAGFGEDVTGSGVSAGYLVFDSIPHWKAIPVGAIILLYNDLDKNPAIDMGDDPEDLLVTDSVYVIPYSSPLLNSCTTTPVAGGGGDCTYFPCDSYNDTGSIAQLGLRNSGDAVQVRSPDGTYYHGVAYGEPGSMMNGGPDSLMIREEGGGQRSFALLDSNYLSVNAYNTYSLSTECAEDSLQTPAGANTEANKRWINYLRGNISLSINVVKVGFTLDKGGNKMLLWETASGLPGTFTIYGIRGLQEDGLKRIPANANQTHYQVALQSLEYDAYRFCFKDESGRVRYQKVLNGPDPDAAVLKAPGLRYVSGYYKVDLMVPETGGVLMKGYDSQGRMLFAWQGKTDRGPVRLRLQGNLAKYPVFVKICRGAVCNTYVYRLN